MVERPVSEALPELYRSILDAVADLEAAGHRREALRVRARAAASYARAWDARAATELEALRAHAVRFAEGGDRPGRRPSMAGAALRALVAGLADRTTA